MPEIKIKYNKSTFEQYDPSTVTITCDNISDDVLSRKERLKFIKLAIDRLVLMLADEAE